MKHELTTEQIKTLAMKAPELKEYLKELAPDAFVPELVEFESMTISALSEPLYIGIGNAPDNLSGKCLMWNKRRFKASFGVTTIQGDEHAYLTIERL